MDEMAKQIIANPPMAEQRLLAQSSLLCLSQRYDEAQNLAAEHGYAIGWSGSDTHLILLKNDIEGEEIG
jgi:hypothetical protein